MDKSMYSKFFLMMGCSFILMYSTMFLNVVEMNHIYISQTRIFMTFLMVAPMAIVMLLFMLSMYKNKTKNAMIIGGAILVFCVSLFLLRSQSTVKDIQYMKAMIPHHSSAILVSENAQLKDPETKKLAKDIIEAQKREIAQMEAIIKRLEATK
ncbi:DUF305 domain-containing protein [Owenweeksia hongkongensis]|uniref:DUF305 domain-containing protein n=1 Tax=Owenweeksia hongkongensis TaxID=253245 RepID=UPI003A8DB8E9